MAIDHSLTYRKFKLSNLPHRLRLVSIEREVRRLRLEPGASYADFGCSNGYITERVRKLAHCSETWGFDHGEANLQNARASYPAIQFTQLDLNQPNHSLPRCDFVTCFETLEHVGDPDSALHNVLAALKPGGVALITVPIEIGWRGLAKFAVKLLYGYQLRELPERPNLSREYVTALARGDRISRFRDRRKGWGTHFGFDYRDVDDHLRRHGTGWQAWNSGTTRFYRLHQPG